MHHEPVNQHQNEITAFLNVQVMSIKVSKFKISRILERVRSDENQPVDM